MINRMGRIFGSSFLAMSVLMASAIAFLFMQIEKKKKALGQDKNFFKQEKRTLFTILIFFDLGYLIRAIWDFC
jgi:hypothetical protein